MSRLFNEDYFFQQYTQVTQAQTPATPSAAAGNSLSGAAQPELLLKDNMSALDLYKNVGLQAAVDWGVDPSELFDTNVYLCNKLAQLQREYASDNWTMDKLLDAMEESGLTPLQHFELYGDDESISFSTLFDSEEYLLNKTKQLYGVVNAENRQATLDAIFDAGMNLWEHFEQYGWLEDVDPSSRFDMSAYMDDKLAQMRESGGGGSDYSMTDLVADLKGAGFNSLTHLARYGESEGLHAKGTYKPYEFTIDAHQKGYLVTIPNVTMDMFKKTHTGPDGKITTGIVGEKIIDAEKTAQTSPLSQDEYKCWAATASNMLQWSGWVNKTTDYKNAGKLTTEDKIFKTFVDNFLYGNTSYGAVKGGLTWFSDGTYSVSDSFDQPQSGTGGFLNKDLTDYITTNPNGDVDSMALLASTLGKGGSVGVRIYQGAKAHLVTCWGYTVNNDYDAKDPKHYTGLIISDSDNSRFFADPTAAPNSLQYMALTWSKDDEHYLTDNPGLPNLGFMTYLASNPMYFS